MIQKLIQSTCFVSFMEKWNMTPMVESSIFFLRLLISLENEYKYYFALSKTCLILYPYSRLKKNKK